MQFNLETKHDKYKPYQHTTTKRFSFLLAVLCTLGLTASAAVGDEFTLSYPSGSNRYDVKYKVTGESPATVKTVEQPNYQSSMPEGMAIVVPQTVTHEGVEYTVTAVDDRSFYGWKGVSFVLPSTVTSLGR